MVRVVTAIVVTLLIISALWWWQPGRRPEPPIPAGRLATDPAAAPAGQHDVGQVPFSPAAASEACDSGREKEAAAVRMAEFEAQKDELLRVLSASTDPEHLLVAALSGWSNDEDRALSLLGEAAARDPRHPLIAAQILTLCTDVDSCIHARPELERNLIAADKGNVVAWAQVTLSRLQRNDERGALAALREAAAAAGLEDYFPDYIMLFDRGLAAASDLEPFDRMVAAVGHAAANATTAYLITRDCERRAPLPEWRDACLRLGERFEHDSRTIVAQAIGIRLQAYMYEVEGDTRAAESTQRRQEEFADRWTQLGRRTRRAEELRDATVFRQYLETFASAGEWQAMEYLAAEVEARLPPLPDAPQPACGAP